MNSHVSTNHFNDIYTTKDWTLFLHSHSSIDYLDESLNTFHRHYCTFKQREHKFEDSIEFEGITCTGEEAFELVRYFNYKIFRYVNDPVSIPEKLIPLNGETSIETKIRRIKYAFIAGMYMGNVLNLKPNQTSELIESIIIGAINED